MKSQQLLIVTVGLLFLLANNLQGQSLKVKNFTMAVSGTSTMHDWQSSVEKMYATGSFLLDANGLAEVKDVVIKIPVIGIKSTKGKMMDNKTYEAFKYEKHPQIMFVINSATIHKSESSLNLKGTLTMAGTSRPVDVLVTYQVLSNGDLKITGAKQITMTDYGIEPPTAMMGAIKVGDQVAVTFEMTLTNQNTIL